MSRVERVFLITSSTGIGAATARVLAAEHGTGARFLLSSLPGDADDRLCEELRVAGAEARLITCDLTEPGFAAVLIDECRKRFGRLDALFNVAGISGRRFGDGPIDVCTEEGWARVMEANLTSQYRMCRQAIQAMRCNDVIGGERGAILNMSSVLALHPSPEFFDTAAYAASKGGVIALTRNAAASCLKDGIRVNCVAPGLVATAMSRRAAEDATVVKYVREKQVLAGGMIDAVDVARCCAFLLGSAARAVTGQCLEVDAGWSVSG